MFEWSTNENMQAYISPRNCRHSLPPPVDEAPSQSQVDEPSTPPPIMLCAAAAKATYSST